MTAVLDFATNLARLRGEQRVIATAVAAGISPRTLNHYEAGRHVPDVHTLDRICAALGATRTDTRAIHKLRTDAEREHKAAVQGRRS